MTGRLETLALEHLPLTHTLHIALFHDVANAPFLQQQLLAGNTGFEYAFIDASIIVSRMQALAAAYRAVTDMLEGRLRTRNVHSEVVFSLGGTNNIAESFRRFGITPTTKNLLVIKISTPAQPAEAEAVQAHLGKNVEGEQVEFSDEVLSSMTDLGRVRKIYKLNAIGGGKNAKGGKGGVKVVGEVAERRELEVLVLGCMALRGAAN